METGLRSPLWTTAAELIIICPIFRAILFLTNSSLHLQVLLQIVAGICECI